MLSTKILRDFKNSGISAPSIDTSMPSRDPDSSFKSNIDARILSQGYCVSVVSLSLLNLTWNKVKSKKQIELNVFAPLC